MMHPKLLSDMCYLKMRQDSLRRRISNDLRRAHAEKKRDLKELREHCLTLTRALALLVLALLALALLDYNGSNTEKSTDLQNNNSDNSEESHLKKMNP